MRIIQFGDVTLPEFNAKQEFKTEFRSSVVTLQGGGFDNDGDLTYILPKVVSASFWVSPAENGAAIDDTIDALLREAAEGSQQLITERRNGTLLYATAKLITSSITEDARYYFPDSTGGEGFTRMSMQFEIPYPYWIRIEDGEESKLNDGNLLNTNVYLNAEVNETIEAITGAAHTFTITNGGNARVYKGTITITVNSGSVTDFRITNTTTGELIEIGRTLNAADTVIIDLLPMTVTLNGNDAYRWLIMGQNQLDFLHLELGDNDIQVDGDFSGANVSLAWSWSRHYVR